ncbi:MAG TPA: MFS transporter [Candidatus Corynebacterium avicola]|uniref:MFS transporter n=1 Tax=Candidatus Corynebacterium avicola TaxID=2838527 RepID=A0A9D1RN34_9CORY|nr:MFS transporter [Candidatus Corynebacterium avicola]
MPVWLFFLALAVFAQGTSEFVLTGLLTAISRELNVSLGEAGMLTSAFAVGMIIGAPLMAAVGRKFPPRLTLGLFLLMFILAHIVGATTGSFAVLLLSRIVSAVANAGFLAVTLSVVERGVPADRRAKALAVILSGTTVSLIIGVPVGAWVGNALDWRSTLWMIAVVCVPALCAVIWSVPSHATETSGTDLKTEFAAMRNRAVFRIVVLTVLVNAGTFGAFTYLGVMAADGACLTGGMVPVLLAMFGVGAFVGVGLAGRYGDSSWRRFIDIAGPLAVAGWALLAVGGAHPVLIWPLTFCAGLVSFGLGSMLITRVVATTRGAPTMGGSVATVALNVGACIGPMVAGRSLGILGNQGPAVVAALAVALAVATWTAVRQRIA